MEYSLCSPPSFPPSWLSSQVAIYSSNLNVVCDHWSRAGAWLMWQHSILSGWSAFYSQRKSTCVVAFPGKPIRHPWNSIQAASLGPDLGENFSHSHMKILLTRFFFFNSVLLQFFFFLIFSAVHTVFILFFYKKPKQPKQKKPLSLSTDILVLVRLRVI